MENTLIEKMNSISNIFVDWCKNIASESLRSCIKHIDWIVMIVGAFIIIQIGISLFDYMIKAFQSKSKIDDDLDIGYYLDTSYSYYATYGDVEEHSADYYVGDEDYYNINIPD